SPFSEPIIAERRSHSTSSNGSMPSREKKRSYSRPGIVVRAGVACEEGVPVVSVRCSVRAIDHPPPNRWPTPVAPRVSPDRKTVSLEQPQTRQNRRLGSPAPVLGWGANMDLVYPAVKTLIHYILCLFGSHNAIQGGIHSLAQGSFRRPILW